MKLVSLRTLRTLRTLKKMGKEKRFIIPCFFTLLNACFGFFSLIKTLEADFIGAAYFILAAVGMDVLDGRVARSLKSTSHIGMELDSLADAVSFCVAPMLLLYNIYFAHSTSLVSIVVLSFYLCAGLSRLARFNVSEKGITFTGLPTSAAALFIAQWVLQGKELFFLSSRLTSVVVLGIVMILGLLMISFLRYPTEQCCSRSFLVYVWCLLGIIFLFSWWYSLPFFLLTSICYLVFGGMVFQLFY